MPRVLRMPDVAADSDEGVLAAWLVEESARFDAAQTIAYVETDDELFSVEAGRPGILLKMLVEPGSRVEPGTPIGILGEPSEQVHDLDSVLAAHRIPSVESTVSTDATAQTEPASGRLTALAVVPQLEDAAEPVALEESADAALPQPGHHYLRARVRVDRLVALSARLERDRPEASVVDLVGRAVIAAHRQVPQLGVARIESDNAASAGIPVTYPGRFGVEEAAAVVPPGQVAVLAVGDVRDEPVLDAGAVVPGKVMTLTLSIRPGRVDDVVASRWLAVLVALLERPEWLVG